MAEHQGHFEGKHGDTLEDIRHYQRITARFLQGYAKHGRVLDIGASEGYFKRFFPNATYTGFDINPRSSLVQKGTIHDARGPFDLIIYCHVLEHLPLPISELMFASAVLGEFGKLFIAVPHSDAPWSYEYDSHLWMFNQKNLPRIAKHAGLVVETMFEVNFRRDCKELWVILSH